MEYLSGSGVLHEDNSTITTCAAQTINLPNATHHSLYTDLGVRIVNVVMADVILLLGNFLNILTLILIAKYKELHTLPFAIAAQIVLSNIIRASVIGIPSLLTNTMGRWMLGAHICIICAFFRFLCTTVRVILFLIFTLDRFGTVFFPFAYPRYSHRIVVTMCLLSWSSSLFFSLAPLPPLLDCYGLIEMSQDCLLQPECSNSCQIIKNIWLYLVFFPSSIITAGLFVALYMKGRWIRRKELHMLGLTKKTISDSDWRALKTISILFGSFFVATFIPSILVLILKKLEGLSQVFILELLFILFHGAFIADPIVILRNADARQSCKKLRSDFKESWSRSCQKC